MDVARVRAGGDDNRRRLAARLFDAVEQFLADRGRIPVEWLERDIGYPKLRMRERLAVAGAETCLRRLRIRCEHGDPGRLQVRGPEAHQCALGDRLGSG